MKLKITPLFNAYHRPARVCFTMSESAKQSLVKAIARAHAAHTRKRITNEQFDMILARADMIARLINAPGFPIYYSVFTEREKAMASAGYVQSGKRWRGNGDRRVIRSLAGFNRDELLFNNFYYDRDHENV